MAAISRLGRLPAQVSAALRRGVMRMAALTGARRGGAGARAGSFGAGEQHTKRTSVRGGEETMPVSASQSSENIPPALSRPFAV